jgi:hypothetical protein
MNAAKRSLNISLAARHFQKNKLRPYLTPNKHRAKYNLQTIKKVVTNDNDSRTS